MEALSIVGALETCNGYQELEEYVLSLLMGVKKTGVV
jgi:hypothetical protein